MSLEKRAKFEDDDEPLDLSVVKVGKVQDQHKNTELLQVIKNSQGNHASNPPLVPSISWNIADSLLAIECQLIADIEYGIRFSPPVEFLYNPISYAFEVHSKYVRQYCQSRKKLLFLGLNAGPWGMSQTGVPFGEISVVTNWLKLTGHIAKPSREHPARKVTGFACRRSEVSGKRFWNLIHELCHTPENFFRHSFLQNYCPVALMDSAGRNITPADLKAIKIPSNFLPNSSYSWRLFIKFSQGLEQATLQFLCDTALVAVVRLLGIEIVVGIGRFAEKRARAALDRAGLSVDVRMSLICEIPLPDLGGQNILKFNNSAGSLHSTSKSEVTKQRELGRKNCGKASRAQSRSIFQRRGDLEYSKRKYLKEISKNRSRQRRRFLYGAKKRQKMTNQVSDEVSKWMDLALEKASDSLKAGEVPVGCLFIYENEVLATGSNTVNETRNATRHAEINCIDEILEFSKKKNVDYREIFKKIDVIVTVEPCIMCSAALHQLKVRSIVYGCANDRFGGCVSVFPVPTIYDDFEINITGNVKGEQAMRLLKQFYKGTNPNAPEDKVKKKSGQKRKNCQIRKDISSCKEDKSTT